MPTPDDDRQVWEVETEHDKITVSRGIDFDNATVIQAVDAETGDLLYIRAVAPIPGKSQPTPSPEP